MPKFRLTDKVSSFLQDGKRYYPGDVVELPTRYGTFNWVEPLKKPKPVEAKEVEAKIVEAPKEAETSKKIARKSGKK